MESKPEVTVLLSDIHLGSPTCQPEQLLRTLRYLNDRYVIICIVIVGDGADDYAFRHLLRRKTRRRQRRVVEWLINFQAQGGLVRYFKGNHDAFHRYYYHGVKYRIEEEAVVCLGGTRCMVIHGDRFDVSVKLGLWYLVVECISLLYLLLQLLSKHCNPGYGPTFLRRHWEESAHQVMLGVCQHARNKGCSVAFFGHTHQPGIKTRFGVTAVNLGCWTLAPAHCAVVTNSEILLYSSHPADGIHVQQRATLPSSTQQ